MREIKFSYIYQHDDTGRILNKIFDIHEIELELMGECFIEGYTLIARRQYTGLTDKLGVEIFVGDIVKDMRGNIGQIIWDNDYCKYICFDEEFNWIYADVIEVTGNIYQNKELLNTKG